MEKTTNKAPRVSIGLPIFNGERYLREALDSLLSQTYADFELVICDNASTDATESICREYVARDPRVRYSRNERNLGAGPNFERAFDLSRGHYFRWAAHDDLQEPDLLGKCVEALDRNPDAVLCQSRVRIIDDASNTMGFYDSGLGDKSGADLFGTIVLTQHWCTDIFGLVRSEVIREIRDSRKPGEGIFRAFHGSDEIVLAEIAMFGGFVKVDEPLFLNREHSNRYSVAIPIKDRGAWYASSGSRLRFHLWQKYRGYINAVRRYQRNPGVRLGCYRHLLVWWFIQWNSIRFLVDIAATFEPRIFTIASVVKKKLFGSAAPMLNR